MANLQRPPFIMIIYPGIDNPMMAGHCGQTYTKTVFPGEEDYEKIIAYWEEEHRELC